MCDPVTDPALVILSVWPHSSPGRLRPRCHRWRRCTAVRGSRHPRRDRQAVANSST